MRTILIIISITLVLLAAVTTPAEAGNGASSYSLIGIGDLRMSTGTRNAGLGYAGLSLATPGYINPMSPASWTRLDRTTIEASALYEGYKASNGTASRYLASLNFSGIAIGLPLDREQGLVLVAGFSPYSNVDFTTVTGGSYTTATDTLHYNVQHKGTGGLNRAGIGVSYAINQSLSVGAAMNYLFGTMDNVTTVTSVGSSFQGNGRVTETTEFSGGTATLGVIYRNFSGITDALRPLALGAVVTTRGTLRTTRQYIHEFGPALPTTPSELDTSADFEGHLSVPFELGLGASYAAGERYVVAVDYHTQPWRTSDYFGATPTNVRSSHRWSAGFERSASRDLSLPWLDRIAYRLGFQYHATYVKIGNQPINEWLITGGMGLPLTGDNRIDLSAEFGKRGVTTNNLINDTIFRFTVAFHLSELWFERPEED